METPHQRGFISSVGLLRAMSRRTGTIASISARYVGARNWRAWGGANEVRAGRSLGYRARTGYSGHARAADLSTQE